MTYHEKRALTTMTSSVLITAAYSVYLFQRYLAGGAGNLNDPHFWGKAFLIFIAVSIVANILISMVFHIIYYLTEKEEGPQFSDERDKLIELKGSRIALWVFSFGVILSMVTQVLDLPLYVMFVTLVYSGLVSSVSDELTQFVLYRRGS